MTVRKQTKRYCDRVFFTLFSMYCNIIFQGKHKVKVKIKDGGNTVVNDFDADELRRTLDILNMISVADDIDFEF